MQPLTVLSLFDGMSCGRIALDRAGLPVARYYASEVDPHGMKVSNENYPDVVQLGAVEGVTSDQVPAGLDLLLGGSPCQGFSYAGQKLNFEDPRSALFFEYVRVLKRDESAVFPLGECSE